MSASDAFAVVGSLGVHSPVGDSLAAEDSQPEQGNPEDLEGSPA